MQLKILLLLVIVCFTSCRSVKTNVTKTFSKTDSVAINKTVLNKTAVVDSIVDSSNENSITKIIEIEFDVNDTSQSSITIGIDSTGSATINPGTRKIKSIGKKETFTDKSSVKKQLKKSEDLYKDTSSTVSLKKVEKAKKKVKETSSFNLIKLWWLIIPLMCYGYYKFKKSYDNKAT